MSTWVDEGDERDDVNTRCRDFVEEYWIVKWNCALRFTTEIEFYELGNRVCRERKIEIVKLMTR